VIGEEREDDVDSLVDHPLAVRDCRAVEREAFPRIALQLPDADLDVERRDATGALTQKARWKRRSASDGLVLLAHGTILESGSSRMSVAPLSFNAGIKMLISDFATTVSNA